MLYAALSVLLVSATAAGDDRQPVSAAIRRRPPSPSERSTPSVRAGLRNVQQQFEPPSADSALEDGGLRPSGGVPPSAGLPPEFDVPRLPLLDPEPTLALFDSVPAQTIDLAMVLLRGRAENWTIELARNRAAAAALDERAARLLWLPDAQAAFTYLYHDGNLQRGPGQIIDVRRQSLFIGGGAVLWVDASQAVFAPRVTREERAAAQAEALAVTNQTLQELVDAYFDLLATYTGVAVAVEARSLAAELVRLCEAAERTGIGLSSNVARARTELHTRRQELAVAEERAVLASTALAVPLRLDPRVQLIPMDAALVPLPLLEDDLPLEYLVQTALTARPEIAREGALVRAAVERLRRQKYAPLLPHVTLGYHAGGFGGGVSGGDEPFFGNFDQREDLTAALVWELPNLGFGQAVRNRRERVEVDAARLRLVRQTDVVVGEVVAAHQVLQRRRAQVAAAREAVEEAMDSYRLNVRQIAGGAGLPIELLQSIQALERSRTEYRLGLAEVNKAQFRLLTAIGQPPVTGD